jgi:hypothetical protein
LWWRIEDKEDAVLKFVARRTWMRTDPLIKFGLFATLCTLVFVVVLALDDTCGFWVCQSRFVAFLDAPANEIGDKLAGIAGALAFLWLVVTVLLQGKELAAQRVELRLTREESARMAAALDAQVGILEDEQKQRTEQRASDTLSAHLNALNRFLNGGTLSRSNWLSAETMAQYPQTLLGADNSSDTIDTKITRQKEGAVTLLSQTQKPGTLRANFDFAEIRSSLENALSEIREIERLRDSLAPSQKIRLREMGLEALGGLLLALQKKLQDIPPLEEPEYDT